ncbi:GNAT family N-acetyltransferase [Streptomyces cucumeris]|uniref:GNAT family N-acetyltransferase n=1 Tax=Streptomyces cucumeris TaxID=2962890 RepID=UPI003D73A10A
MTTALFALHQGLPRQGPGSDTTTARLLRLAGPLPPRPRIMDLGCGPGRSALVLAAATGGHVTGVDLHQPFLDELSGAATRDGLSDRIAALNHSMDEPPFADGSFDLIWAEGSVYNIGFGTALRAWRRLLAPRGVLVVTEAEWATSCPAPRVRAFWDAAYPLRSRADNVRTAEEAGYRVGAHHPLPDGDWWTEYYTPLTRRLATADPDRPGMAQAVAAVREEIDLRRDHGADYRYAGYVLHPVTPDAGPGPDADPAHPVADPGPGATDREHPPAALGRLTAGPSSTAADPGRGADADPPRPVTDPGRGADGPARPRTAPLPPGTTEPPYERNAMTVWTTRPETPGDAEAIRAVNVAAFPTAGEADLVEALRADSGAWIDGLSVVAEHEDGTLAGHALLTRCHVGGRPALALAPCAVLPAHQGRGAGSAAIRAALEAARSMGENLVVVLGHADYYPRFGFAPASRLGIRASFEVPDEALMALAPDPSRPVPSGVIEYPAAFGV